MYEAFFLRMHFDLAYLKPSMSDETIRNEVFDYIDDHDMDCLTIDIVRYHPVYGECFIVRTEVVPRIKMNHVTIQGTIQMP